MRTYIFKVKPKHVKSFQIKIELREDQTLDHLHKKILEAIDWDEDHLYSFFMSGKAWDQESEYTCPHESFLRNEKTANIELKALHLEPKQKFLYLYDFGDENHFHVEVFSEGKVLKGEKYPKILESKGKPPEQYYFEDDDEIETEWPPKIKRTRKKKDEKQKTLSEYI